MVETLNVVPETIERNVLALLVLSVIHLSGVNLIKMSANAILVDKTLGVLILLVPMTVNASQDAQETPNLDVNAHQ